MITEPVIIDNFIEPADAEVLIKEMHDPSEINPYPEYYKTRFGGTGFPYNKTVLELQKKYAIKSNEVHQSLNQEEPNEIKTFKCFGSTWKVGGYGLVHIDDQDPEPFIEYSTVVYLDDDFEGGVIYFPALNFEYKPKKYSAVFFLSRGNTWKHGITPVESGSRSTLLYMHTTQHEHVDPDLD
jgi:hypothetical protein